MLWSVLITLLILWSLGLLSGIAGQWIHVLLVIVLILLVIVARRDKPGIGNG